MKWITGYKLDKALQRILSGGRMETPDITKNQAIALGVSILNTLLAFGIELTQQQQHAILGLYVVCVGLLWSDHKIRGKRAEIEAAAQYSTTRETE